MMDLPDPCYWCELENELDNIPVIHPYHSNGELNERDLDHYKQGGTNGTPIFHTEENGYQ